MAIDDLFNIAGQTIVVTGGLGQLGQVFTKGLRERGAKVAILDSTAKGEEKADDLIVLKADITQRDEVERAYARLAEVLGRPTGLINNAGIDSPPGANIQENGPFEAIADTAFNRVLNVNVTGAVICCQVIGGAMAESGGGSIVNIGSIYGHVSPDQRLYEFRRSAGELFYKPAAYGASKAALDNLTKYLATYWADKDVRVNTLCFGGFKANQAQEFLDEYESRVPMRRMANTGEAVGPAVFLLSRASSYMTGARLTIDGGFTAF
jgi:NAD(P)-dependent dehydrogenase (short-subunit alcohol dehydrogenase family)